MANDFINWPVNNNKLVYYISGLVKIATIKFSNKETHTCSMTWGRNDNSEGTGMLLKKRRQQFYDINKVKIDGST